jgi:two-component system LytT family response regulator
MARSLRVLVVDDEPLARGKLSTFISRFGDVQLVAECATAADAVRVISEGDVDIVFLDVQMPDGTGFDVIERVGADRMPVTVFVTAYDAHALRAFEASAADYLLKPFDEDRFSNAMNRAQQLVMGRARIEGGTAGPEAEFARGTRLPAGGYAERLVIRVGGGYGFVRTADIEWIEASNNYVTLHQGANKWLIRRSISSLEGELDPRKFLRVHRSAIVNVDKVRLVRIYSGVEYNLVLESGATVLTGRRYRERIRSGLLQQSGAADGGP